MDIANLLAPERVRCGVEATSKKRTLELLSELLTGDAADPATRSVFESLIGRERLGATGLGHGVALPHARIANLERPIAALVTLAEPVDFDAIDKQPVDLLFALLVPEQSTNEHLLILRSLAEMFSDSGLCDRLRKSRSGDEMLTHVTRWQGNGAAS